MIRRTEDHKPFKRVERERYGSRSLRQEAVGGSALGQSHLWTTLALIRVFEIGAPLHAIEVFCLEVPASNKTRSSFLLPERVGDVTLTGHTTDLSASRAGNNRRVPPARRGNAVSRLRRR